MILSRILRTFGSGAAFPRPITRLLQLHETAGFGPSTGPTHEEVGPEPALIVVNQRENEVGLFSFVDPPQRDDLHGGMVAPLSGFISPQNPTPGGCRRHRLETAFGFEPLCKKLIATLPASQRVTSKNLEIKECLVLPEERASNPFGGPLPCPHGFLPSPSFPPATPSPAVRSWPDSPGAPPVECQVHRSSSPSLPPSVSTMNLILTLTVWPGADRVSCAPGS